VRRLIVPVAAALLLAGCGGKPATRSLVIAVDAPVSRDAYIGTTIANGARLAARQLRLRPGAKTEFRVVIYDNAGSPSRAVSNIRRAVARHAAAIVSDGTGVDAGWKLAARAHVPICVVYDGDDSLVDAKARPNVFRIAPTDHGMAFRFAEYLIPKRLKLGFLTDDTGYGRAGRAALDRAFSENRGSVATHIQIPSSTTDLAPQVLQARRAGATALLVWGQPAAIAEAVVAARRGGWKVPIYAPPSAEDPLVRQELAGRPQWLDGLTFASSRLTAEEGAAPFVKFQTDYEAAFGAQKVGVKDRDGRPVFQPPEFAMYAYDFVNVLAAAIDAAHTTRAPKVLAAMNQVSTEGVNGDSRGFNQASHEGVVDDDVYFAQFTGMVFHPVKDDPLSRTLPAINQGP
jgi:ABC-type branched-subunit amino acid transport system substrate-binding protein